MTQAQPTGGDVPPWLVDLVMTPPWWALLALVAAAAITLVLAGRKVYGRDLYISRDEQRQVLLIVGTAEGVALGVMVAMDVFDLAYLPAVVVGLVGGFAIVEIARRCAPVLSVFTPDVTAHIAIAWATVGVVALGGPAVVDGGRASQALTLGVGTISAAMFLWSVMQGYGPGETMGDVVREGATDD